jgi:DNA-binding LacI/PurR family transcriptional regulator
LVLVLGTVGSVAAQNDAEKIKIGMANLSLCCPYFIGMSEAVEQEASVYDNVQVLVTNADGDVEKLTSDIEDLIAKKVDGIVLSGAFINATICRIKDRAEFPRMGQEQTLQFVVVTDTEEHGHRIAIPCDDHRPRSTRLQVRTEVRLHVGYRSNLHNSTSSPAM